MLNNYLILLCISDDDSCLNRSYNKKIVVKMSLNIEYEIIVLESYYFREYIIAIK